MGRDTHYEGCWSDPKHQACAVAEIARLQNSVTYWREENERLRAAVDLREEDHRRKTAEIERLRGILEDACRWHEQFPVQRVREVVGEVK